MLYDYTFYFLIVIALLFYKATHFSTNTPTTSSLPSFLPSFISPVYYA